MVHYQLLSSYSEAEGVPYQGDALNFFRPPLIHQKQIGANKVRVVHYQLLSSYSVPGGVPCQGDACRGVLHTPPPYVPRKGAKAPSSLIHSLRE